MATSIPPHNAGELCSAALHLIDHPEATTKDLMQFVPGPDFPTGGVIVEPRVTRRGAHLGQQLVGPEAAAQGHRDEVLHQHVQWRLGRPARFHVARLHGGAQGRRLDDLQAVRGHERDP